MQPSALIALSNLQCRGVVVKERRNWCCLVTKSEIQYRKSGDMILYYKNDTMVKCQSGFSVTHVIQEGLSVIFVKDLQD